MKRVPLILAPHDDANAAAVYWGLKQMGIEPAWGPSLSAGPIEAISIHKVSDLRVTIIGDRMFPVRMRSIQGTAFVDWRSYTYLPEMAVDACELPERCRDQLRALMSRLGLVFGCVDLVVDGEGDIHFLEVNQGGQFLFAEERVESLPLLAAMCALLAEGRSDYSLDPSLQVSMRGFMSSAYCDEWRRRYADRGKMESWLCSGE